MLSKKDRIPRELFKDLAKNKAFSNSPHFSLMYSLGGTRPRFGVSVSKKVSKKAVVRNRTRRRVYSILREFLPQTPNGLYLLMAKPGVEKLKGKELKDELTKLIKLKNQ